MSEPGYLESEPEYDPSGVDLEPMLPVPSLIFVHPRPRFRGQESGVGVRRPRTRFSSDEARKIEAVKTINRVVEHLDINENSKKLLAETARDIYFRMRSSVMGPKHTSTMVAASVYLAVRVLRLDLPIREIRRAAEAVLGDKVWKAAWRLAMRFATDNGLYINGQRPNVNSVITNLLNFAHGKCSGDCEGALRRIANKVSAYSQSAGAGAPAAAALLLLATNYGIAPTLKELFQGNVVPHSARAGLESLLRDFKIVVSPLSTPLAGGGGSAPGNVASGKGSTRTVRLVCAKCGAEWSVRVATDFRNATYVNVANAIRGSACPRCGASNLGITDVMYSPTKR